MQKVSELPETIIYDLGCDVKRLVEKHFPKDHGLNKKRFIIDKFHFTNHTEAYCKKNCDPRECSEGVNTVVCEQINFWISKYKHIVKHMNSIRYIFFIFIIFDYFNEMKIKNNLREIKRKIN